jgi:opacity protein-like surface antigen
MKKLLVLIMFFAFLAVNFAGDKSRKGTTGADQLLIPVGARGIATGEAFLSNITGLEAIYYNPAGFAHQQGSEAMFSYMSYLDINVSYFAVGTNLGDLGSFAFTIKTFDFGEIPVTTFDAPDGTGDLYSPSFLTAGVTYSKIITDRVSIGVNAKVISESIMDVNAVGFGIDFGVQYKFDNNLSLGAAVKNVGSNMQYGGSALQHRAPIQNALPGSRYGMYQIVTESFQLPSYFELAVGYKFNFDEQNNLQIASTFRNNNALEDQMKFGLEYGFMNMFFIRSGYDLLLENTNQNTFGLTAGAGVNYQMADGVNLTLDYAFREVKEFPTANHIITLKLGIE